jgi:hypothetical protein
MDVLLRIRRKSMGLSRVSADGTGYGKHYDRYTTQGNQPVSMHTPFQDLLMRTL